MGANVFKGRHFEAVIILQCLRWYLKYPISYRNLEEMLAERGIDVDHTTIYRWIQSYSPEFEKRIKWYSKVLGFSWHVDETYIKIKGEWKYLYRAIDNAGRTIDFCLFHRRDLKTAKKFFKKALARCYENPLEIITDKHHSYKRGLKELQAEDVLSQNLKHKTIKYLNNLIESDHSRLKRLINPMLGFKSFKTANRTIKGIEAMLMITKNQTLGLTKSLKDQIVFINNLFEVYA
jgi:transposase-like protein